MDGFLLVNKNRTFMQITNTLYMWSEQNSIISMPASLYSRANMDKNIIMIFFFFISVDIDNIYYLIFIYGEM